MVIVGGSRYSSGIEAVRHSYGERGDQFGELTRPEAPQGPWPVAVLIHGGYWRAKYDLRLQDPLVPDLAGRGWAVWNLEYRRLGWRSRGGWPATFQDVAAGIDHLGRLDAPLDLARVVVAGHSAGGHLALWAASRRGLPADAPGAEPAVRPAAVVAQAGVIDLREAARLNLSNGAAASLLGGPPGKLPRRYDVASPIERLPLGVPQLLVHGERDDIVPPEMSRTYARDAAAAGDRVDLALHAQLGHFEHLDAGSPAWQSVRDWLPL